jgi:hypothetical protein
MFPPLQAQGDLFTERGYTVQTATAEGTTGWRAELRIGAYIDGRFRYKANPIFREFPLHEGLLNHLLSMGEEARAVIAVLPPLDQGATT